MIWGCDRMHRIDLLEGETEEKAAIEQRLGHMQQLQREGSD